MKKIVVFCIVIFATQIATGCSLGAKDKSVKDVTTCLKKMGLEVEQVPKDDKKLKDGVSGLSPLPKANDKKPTLTIALAGHAKSEKAAKDFQKTTKTIIKAMNGDDDKKYSIESDIIGTYIWAVASNKKSDFEDAKSCVKP